MRIAFFNLFLHPHLMLTFQGAVPDAVPVPRQGIFFCNAFPTIGAAHIRQNPFLFALITAKVPLAKRNILKYLAAECALGVKEDRLLASIPVFPDAAL